MVDSDGQPNEWAEDDGPVSDDFWSEEDEFEFDWEPDEPDRWPLLTWLDERLQRLVALVPGTAAFWSRLKEEARGSVEWRRDELEELGSLSAGQKGALWPFIRTIETTVSTLRAAEGEVSDGIIRPLAMILAAVVTLSAPLLANAWWAGAEYPLLVWLLLSGATLIAGFILSMGVILLGVGFLLLVSWPFHRRFSATILFLAPAACLPGPAILVFWLARALTALEVGQPDAWGLLWVALPLAGMGASAVFTGFFVAEQVWASAFAGWAIRRHVRHLIPYALLTILESVDSWPKDWESADFRREVGDALAAVADLISQGLTRHLLSGDRIADPWIRTMTAEMADHLRWLKVGLLLPVADWRQRLMEDLSHNLEHAARGHWGALKRRPLHEPLWRQALSRGMGRFSALLWGLARALALPLALWALQRSSLALPGLAADLAAAVALLWAAIQLLIILGWAFSVRPYPVLGLRKGLAWDPELGTALDWPPEEMAAERDRMVFVTLVSSPEARARAKLLIDSLRSFGGAMRECPVWLFEADPERAACADLAGNGVEVHPLEVPESVRHYWFAAKVCACARAEKMAGPEVDCLVWMAPDCLIIQPPGYLRPDSQCDVTARPVHHKNIGLRVDEPLDPFWWGVYRAAGVSDVGKKVESFVDGERLRAYYNSHVLAVRPERGIFRLWFQLFEKLVCDEAFQEAACQDVRHQIFLHQAVLSTLLAEGPYSRSVRQLPPEYSYPYNLHGQVPADRRAKALNDLVCIAYEDRPLHPDQVDDIEIREPLRSWLAERVERGDTPDRAQE